MSRDDSRWHIRSSRETSLPIRECGTTYVLEENVPPEPRAPSEERVEDVVPLGPRAPEQEHVQYPRAKEAPISLSLVLMPKNLQKLPKVQPPEENIVVVAGTYGANNSEFVVAPSVEVPQNCLPAIPEEHKEETSQHLILISPRTFVPKFARGNAPYPSFNRAVHRNVTFFKEQSISQGEHFALYALWSIEQQIYYIDMLVRRREFFIMSA